VLMYDWTMLVRCNDNFVVKSKKIYALPMLLKYLMPPKKYQKEAAARARKATLAARTAKQSRASVHNVNIPSGLAQNHDNDSLVIEILSSGSESGYYGGVDTILSSDDNLVTSELSEGNLGSAEYESLSEFDEQDVGVMRKQGEMRLEMNKSEKDWKGIEMNRTLGYNGHSSWTQHRNALEARKGKKEREEVKNSSV
jgi:hypothetical protein